MEISIQDILTRVTEKIKQAEERESRARLTLPCQFELAQVHRCSQEWEAQCEFQASQICPKQILVQQAQENQELRHRAREHGIPERALRRIFDRPPAQTPSLKVVRAFMKNPHKNILILSGTNACGKTTAAAWACLPPRDADWPKPTPGYFVRLVDLEAAGRFSELLLRLRNAPVVTVDDIGAAHFGNSGWLASLFEDVMDAAYQGCHKLILTTDLLFAPDLKEPEKPCLANLLSRRALSRIKDAGVVETQLGGRYE